MNKSKGIVWSLCYMNVRMLVWVAKKFGFIEDFSDMTDTIIANSGIDERNEEFMREMCKPKPQPEKEFRGAFARGGCKWAEDRHKMVDVPHPVKEPVE